MFAQACLCVCVCVLSDLPRAKTLRPVGWCSNKTAAETEEMRLSGSVMTSCSYWHLEKSIPINFQIIHVDLYGVKNEKIVRVH